MGTMKSQHEIAVEVACALQHMTKRAENALRMAGYNPSDVPVIAALADFASQNSGIDPRNYFSSWTDKNGYRAFKSEQRSISEDWRRFKSALMEAGAEGVTDADVLAEAPSAYSGRLEWHGGWKYCTGQYFPTEYRKAAVVLLEYATNRVRQSRPKQSATIRTISDLKELNRKNGGCWFDRSTMRFFGTRIESGIIARKYFITSEQPPHAPANTRSGVLMAKGVSTPKVDFAGIVAKAKQWKHSEP